MQFGHGKFVGLTITFVYSELQFVKQAVVILKTEPAFLMRTLQHYRDLSGVVIYNSLAVVLPKRVGSCTTKLSCGNKAKKS